MSIVTKANKRFQEVLVSQKPEVQMSELSAKMAKFDMTMQGKPFPTFLKPYLVDLKDRKEFASSTQLIMAAIERVAAAFFSDDKFKRLVELDGRVAEFATMNPIYPNRQIVARLDAFYTPETGDIKFIEFNCDSPSGMGWHDVMIDMFWELECVKGLHKDYPLKTDKFLDTHCAMMIKKYQQFCEAKGVKPSKDPFLAMVCARESTVKTDVEIISSTLRQKGYRSRWADPRDFTYDGKKLMLDGDEVHLIYRDAIQEFLDEPYFGHTDAALNAYRDGNICFINPFSSRVGGLKSILAVMHDDQFANLFTEEQREAIKKYIPWTRLMREGKTDYHGKTVDLAGHVRDNRAKMVLKPTSGYGGKNVVIGPDVDDQEWQNTMKIALTPGNNYVVQELVPIPADEFPVMVDGQFKGFAKKNVNINFWAFDGVFGGAYVRAAAGSIINIHQGGGLVPVFYVDKH